MAENDTSAAVTAAENLDAVSGDLVRLTREVLRPSDSHQLLGNLTTAQESLAQVYVQLAEWHSQVVQGVHYAGEEEPGGSGNAGWLRAELALEEAARSARAVAEALKRAHSANGLAEWFDEVRSDELDEM
jgi:hypothetical protein